MNSQKQITAPALFPFFLMVGILGILCLPCLGQEPSASKLFARNKVLIDRANELFPSPYNDFGPARSYEHTNGIILPYRLFKPEREHGEVYPMILFLHGSGGTGTDNLGQFRDLIVPPTVWAFPENQAKHPCYVLIPQGPDRPSWPHARIPALKALLDSLIANNPIDSNRIYISGLSMGGMGTWAIIQEHPDFFAAAVPICGGGDMNELVGIINNHLPVWAFHGEVDPVVDIDAFSDRWNAEDAFTGQRTLVQELISRGMEPTPKHTWYPDVEHNSWDGAYSDPLLFDWIFSQSKSGNVTRSTGNPKISLESINSKVIPRAETRRNSGNWGVMDVYTYDHASTYGTENMFTAITDLLPGESVHPTHRHAEEEFLFITKGTGVWSLEGKQFEANTGDLLYASPWKMHGLVNTGTDTLTFFFLKWLNKGVPSPAEPEGDHEQKPEKQ